MGLAMIALSGGVLVCLALSRERALATGWIPAITMLGAMLAVAAGGLLPNAIVLLFAVPLLVTGAMAARGPDRLMSVHRGISAIAMAALCVGAAAAEPTGGTTSGSVAAPAESHHTTVIEAGFLQLGLAVAVAGIGIAVAMRFVRELRPIRAAGIAVPGSGALMIPRIEVARLAEVLLMTASVAVMSIHT